MNKQNKTNKIDSSLGKGIIDDLLALKKEMAGRIEEIMARIEQNSDRRLEDAILFLAGSGDGENLEDSIGFNETDSRFGHCLARQLQSGAMLTVKQAHTALQMMQKYSKTQLEPNGYLLPMTWEEIFHQYHESKIDGDLPGLRMVLKRDEEHGTYIAVYSPGDGYFGEILSYSDEDDTWYEGGGWEGFSLGMTETLLAKAAGLIEDGYACYVDPDIEAAYYVWQEEQKSGTGSGRISALFSRSATSSESSSNDTVDPIGDVPLEMAMNLLRRVENQWGGNNAPWHNGGIWLMGCRPGQNIVAINIKSDDGGKTLYGNMTYANEGPIGFRATLSDGNNYAVENQWGGDDAPWHDGGQWIIGARSRQNVVELNVKSDDGGNTLNGTMIYEGEGPIGFKATMIEYR